MTTDTIRSITARPVVIPFQRPPRSASGALQNAALILIDVNTSDGITGRSYVFAYSEAMQPALVKTIEALADMVLGDAVAPMNLETKLLSRLKLLDTPGLVGIALSGLDMAFWDAHSKKMNMPLAVALGSVRQRIPAYNSCGLGIQDVDSLADEAEELLSVGGFKAIKLRLGRASAADDLAAIGAVRNRVGDAVNLMVDFNQSQSVSSAIHRARMIDDERLFWIEEPVRHSDYTGTAAVRAEIRTPLQTGENLCNQFDMMTAINAGAADFYMPDVQRIGGVSGWLRASALCQAHGLEMSSHLFPEISAHLLAASPNCHWLEYVDWANPVLQTPTQLEDGFAILPDKPGNGLEWNEEAVSRYIVADR